LVKLITKLTFHCIFFLSDQSMKIVVSNDDDDNDND
jgi:hypothetical protein